MDIEQLPYITEEVINGVLHYREGDAGDWKEYSKEELTEMYMLEQESFNKYFDRVNEVADMFA